MLLRERGDTLRDREVGRGGDDLGAERLRHLEATVDLLIGHIRAEAVVVRVDDDAGRVELLLDGAEMIERRVDAPRPQVLARSLTGLLDLRRDRRAGAGRG